MKGYVPLPAFRAPSPIDFSGINSGIDAVGKKLEQNRLLDQNKAIGEAIQSGGYGGGADAAFAQGNLSVGGQLAGLESSDIQQEFQRNRLLAQDKRTAASDARSQELHGLNVEKAKSGLHDQLIGRVAGLAQAIRNETDPERKALMVHSLVSAHPRLQQQFSAYGLDPANPDPTMDMIIAEAQGLRTPSKDQYQFTKYGVGNKSTGELQPYPQGVAPAEDKLKSAKFEQDLRKEFASLSKDYRSIQEGADRVRVGAELDNAVGDLSLIFGYMKLLDPGSVVREGEFANAENAQGVPDRIRNTWNKIMSGERLNPNSRQEFVNAAEALANEQTIRQKRIIDQFQGIATESGIDPSRVIMDFGANPQNGQPKPSPFPDYPNAKQAPDGNWYIEQNGQFFRIDQ